MPMSLHTATQPLEDPLRQRPLRAKTCLLAEDGEHVGDKCARGPWQRREIIQSV